jgi:hypothetical protein
MNVIVNTIWKLVKWMLPIFVSVTVTSECLNQGQI